jgi:DNA-binding response OmpR family regulator
VTSTDPRSEKTGTHRPILILDDDRDLTKMMKRYLEHEGWNVLVVNEPMAAIETCLEHKPCLLLVDLMMPGVDGEEFVKAIRKVLFEAVPPIALVSAAFSRPEVQRRLGLPASLSKPFSMEDLKDLALRFAHAHRTRADTVPPS